MPDQPDVAALIQSATDALNGGDIARALELASEIRRTSGPSADESLIRGIALSQSGQVAAASDAFAEAIRQSPSSHKVLFNAAVHEYNAGNLNGAEDLGKQALAVDASHAGTQTLLQKIGEDRIAKETSAAPPVVSPSDSYVPPSSAHYPRETQQAVIANGWIDQLGPWWPAVAGALIVAGLVSTGLQLSLILPAAIKQQAAFNPMAFAKETQDLPIMRLASYMQMISMFGAILWTVLDLVRRRGNFLWLLAVVPFSCIGFAWIGLPVYLLLGRKKTDSN